MVEGRSKAALSRFFIEQGPRWCQNVKTVVTDGSHSYRAAVHCYLPGARHVLDRFHAVRWFRPGADPGTPGTATPPAARCETRLSSGPASAPGSLFSKDMTTLLEPNRDASTGYSPFIRVFGWLGTLYKSSTASIRPTTSKAPWTLSNASPTSTKPARFPSTTTPWTPY